MATVISREGSVIRQGTPSQAQLEQAIAVVFSSFLSMKPEVLNTVGHGEPEPAHAQA